MNEPNFNSDVSLLNDNFAVIYSYNNLEESFHVNSRSITLKVDGLASFAKDPGPFIPTVKDVRTYQDPTENHYLVSADTYLTLGDGKSVFLIRDQDAPHSKGFITNPGGMTDTDPLTCCLRELNEEILLIRPHPHRSTGLQVALIAFNGQSAMSVEDKEDSARGIFSNPGINAAKALAKANIDASNCEIDVVQLDAVLDPRFIHDFKRVSFESESRNVVNECFVPIWLDQANTLVCNLPLVIPDIKTTDGWFAIDGEKYDREAIIDTVANIIDNRNPPAASWTNHLAKIAEGCQFRMPDDVAFRLDTPRQLERRELRKRSLLAMPAL